MSKRNPKLEEIEKKAHALASEGLDADSEKLLREAIPQFPESAELKLQLATRIFDRAPEEAKGLLRQSVELAPRDPWALSQAADLMFHLGETENAFEYAKRAHEETDESFDGLPMLSHIMGQIAEKKDLYMDAERFLRFAFEEEPSMPTYGHELAALYFTLDRFDDALEVVKKTSRYRQDDQGLKELRINILDCIARSEDSLENDQESELREAISNSPEDPDLQDHLFAILFKGKPDEAKELLRQCEQSLPDDPWRLTLCGSLLFDLDEVDEAVECARRAARIVDYEFRGWPLLGDLMLRISAVDGHSELAEKAIRPLRLRFEEDSADLELGTRLACLLNNTGHFDEALKMFDKLMHNSPDDEDLQALRAMVLERIEENEE